MATDTWDPNQYNRFQEERAQPFFDLMALVEPRPAMRVVDLGCGTGELTERLHRHVKARETLGIDSSTAMLEKSSAFAGDGIRFERGDIRDFSAAGSYDLVFSNAALQWVPGHAELLPRLTAALAADGQLAIQMPANFDHPSHVVAAEVGMEPPFRAALADTPGAAPGEAVRPPEEYAVHLDRLGYRAQHVRLQVYAHRLASREDVVEWVKGTCLTEYQRRLPDGMYEPFLARYRERLLPRLADTRPHLFTFKRLLIWGRR